MLVMCAVVVCVDYTHSWYSARLQDGRPSFNSWQEQDIFLFSTASRPAMGPTQPPIRRVSEALSLEVKRLVQETDHSLPYSVEVKNGEDIHPLPYTSSWRDA
jgi:hypothetical protein